MEKSVAPALNWTLFQAATNGLFFVFTFFELHIMRVKLSTLFKKYESYIFTE